MLISSNIYLKINIRSYFDCTPITFIFITYNFNKATLLLLEQIISTNLCKAVL